MYHCCHSNIPRFVVFSLSIVFSLLQSLLQQGLAEKAPSCTHEKYIYSSIFVPQLVERAILSEPAEYFESIHTVLYDSDHSKIPSMGVLKCWFYFCSNVLGKKRVDHSSQNRLQSTKLKCLCIIDISRSTPSSWYNQLSDTASSTTIICSSVDPGMGDVLMKNLA